MCSKFGQSGLFTLELPALIAEKTIFDHLGMLDSGERLLSFVLGTQSYLNPLVWRLYTERLKKPDT